jgi:hypothetical protein
MKVGDLVRDIRCGTLCIIKRVAQNSYDYMVVWSFVLNEEISISTDNLELADESR